MIRIYTSKTADSRTSKGDVSKNQLLASSIQHIEDVQKGMQWFADKLIEAGSIHDHTKITGIDDFYDAFSKKLQGDAFKKEKWYSKQHLTERHHLTDKCPDDVNLIDIIERVVDTTMAGMARSGSVYKDELDPKILVKAYDNTLKLFKSQIEVVDKGE